MPSEATQFVGQAAEAPCEGVDPTVHGHTRTRSPDATLQREAPVPRWLGLSLSVQ